MRLRFLLYSGLALFFVLSASAEEYRSEHFVIHSDLDPRIVEIYQKNCEAFYESMLAGRYFRSGWQEPLTIYYSKTHSDTFKLYFEHGLKGEE